MTDALTLSRRALVAGTGAALLASEAANSGTLVHGKTGNDQLRRTTMNITRNGSQPSSKGPAEYFTGAVRLDMRFKGSPPARIGGAIVTFEPGARTAWHTHPLGQTLIVTAGMGWVQTQGGPKEEISAGDMVWIPPGEKHWHGATPSTAMTHIAISEALDGNTVDWLEQVTDAQFNG
jgi:quercetin dioxygenase-like cupin family protein